jgi:CRP-like cAMP-binding protein
VHLSHIRTQTRRWLAPLALDQDTVQDLVLAVNEAAGNAIEHAYTTRDHVGAEPEEFLARIDEADRAGLIERGRPRRWPAGATLFLEGDTSQTVLIVVSGRVKVFSLTEQGEEIVLAVRGPGALLGELSAIDGGVKGASVATLEPVVGLVVPVPAFVEYLRAHGQAATVLLRLITSRLRDADRKRVEFGAFDIAARLAGRLVELADRFGEPDEHGVRITVPLSQDELAGWVGASREAVAKALRVLRERGYVTTGRRTMTVLDLDRLRRRARG